jgi:hypothetical protein
MPAQKKASSKRKLIGEQEIPGVRFEAVRRPGKTGGCCGRLRCSVTSGPGLPDRENKLPL